MISSFVGKQEGENLRTKGKKFRLKHERAMIRILNVHMKELLYPRLLVKLSIFWPAFHIETILTHF
jgi:hypothetical protein